MSEQETNLPVTEGHHHHVRIHIDRTPYESSTPTSGAALYVLANVQSNHALYREVEGDHEDKTPLSSTSRLLSTLNKRPSTSTALPSKMSFSWRLIRLPAVRTSL